MMHLPLRWQPWPRCLVGLDVETPLQSKEYAFGNGRLDQRFS